MIKKILDDVFGYRQCEKILIMLDGPATTASWKWRHGLAEKWESELSGFPIRVLHYQATGENNSPLPKKGEIHHDKVDVHQTLRETDIVIALTEYSATAPLMEFTEHGLRGASMPGFNKRMVPALQLDYTDVAEKVARLHDLLRQADSCDIIFRTDRKYRLHLDIQDQPVLKDDGICRTPKIINLPSGEAFTVPRETSSSKTQGQLPITFQEETAVYRVENNHIVAADKDTALLRRIRDDPAVGNLAELAFGVLGLYGIKSVGRTLLDEKLGLHIALGRSDHFGGRTGPDAFRKKDHVWHQDFVFVKGMQPATIVQAQLDRTSIIKHGKYTLF